MEFDDSELRAEHFLTVACYNLQHPAQFTEGTLELLRAGLVDYLDGRATTEQLRRRAARQFEGAARVLRPASERRPTRRSWATTIADVYLPGGPHGAAERVRAWGAAIRAASC